MTAKDLPPAVVQAAVDRAVDEHGAEVNFSGGERIEFTGRAFAGFLAAERARVADLMTRFLAQHGTTKAVRDAELEELRRQLADRDAAVAGWKARVAQLEREVADVRACVKMESEQYARSFTGRCVGCGDAECPGCWSLPAAPRSSSAVERAVERARSAGLRAEVIRRRTALGMTLRDLASRVGVTYQAIGAWERGEDTALSRERVQQILACLTPSKLSLEAEQLLDDIRNGARVRPDEFAVVGLLEKDARRTAEAEPEVERLRRRVAEYDGVITYGTTCGECAGHLDREHAAERRAADVEREAARLRGELEAIGARARARSEELLAARDACAAGDRRRRVLEFAASEVRALVESGEDG